MLPRPVAGTQAAPVYEAQANRASSGFDVPAEDVVIPHRSAVAYRLEYEVLGPIRLHQLVFPQCALPPAPSLNSEQFQPVNPLNDVALNGHRRIAGLRLWL